MDNVNNMNGYANASQPVNNMNYGAMPIFKWNWGAFTMPFIFGVANRAYMCLLVLLSFIPVIGQLFALIWIFVCEAKGAKWTWESGSYRTPEEFNAVMDSWNRGGLICFIISCIAIAVLILCLILFAALGISLTNAILQSL